jgi:hypothetical protein
MHDRGDPGARGLDLGKRDVELHGIGHGHEYARDT